MNLLTRTLVVNGVPTTAEAHIEASTFHLWRGPRVKGSERVPTPAELARAARFDQKAPPSHLGMLAVWMTVLDDFTNAGWTLAERLQVVVEVFELPIAGGQMPPVSVLCHAAIGVAPADLEPLVTRLAAVEHALRSTNIVACSLSLIEAGTTVAAVDDARLFRLPPASLRSVLLAFPRARRDAFLVRLMRTEEPNAARYFLGCLCFVLDLCQEGEPAIRLAKLRELCGRRGNEGLFAVLDAGGHTFDVDGLSEPARRSLEYWENLFRAARQEGGLGPVVEHATTERVSVANVSELSDWSAWDAVDNARRIAIANIVLEAIGKKRFRFVGLELHGSHAIAVFAHRRKKTRFSLLCGGEFQRGFSDAEDATLTAGAQVAGIIDHYEEYGQLRVSMAAARPCGLVTVKPMLVGQAPGVCMPPPQLIGWVTRGPWRLPSESEWEYAARGGATGKLTHRGDAMPLSDWFVETNELGAGAANDFGLWGFGARPEVCADLFLPDYTTVPVDGSPAVGVGARVARGGADELFPWQECGEWHLLLTAMRGSVDAWEFSVAARPVIGLTLGQHPDPDEA